MNSPKLYDDNLWITCYINVVFYNSNLTSSRKLNWYSDVMLVINCMNMAVLIKLNLTE